MIIDSSALIAILNDEDDAASFVAAIESSEEPLRMSAANWFEAAIIVDSRRNPSLSRAFDYLIERSGIEIDGVSPDHMVIARAAYRDFGKGSGHPAGLNFGDCFAYALATELREPILFKGNDFIHTDLRSAI